MSISHRKEIRKLTFRALARFVGANQRRANARNVSFRISLRWLIHIINPVDKTQFSHIQSVNLQQRLFLLRIHLELEFALILGNIQVA